MHPIQIRVPVDAATAIRGGVNSAGAHDVTIEPSRLTQTARDAVASMYRHVVGSHAGDLAIRDGAPKPPAAPTTESVHAWLEEYAAWIARSKLEAEARDARDREDTIQRVLALPLSAWISVGYASGAEKYFADSVAHYAPRVVDPIEVGKEIASDPRIVARREQAERELLPAARAEWEAGRAAVEAADRQRAAERAAEHAEREAAEKRRATQLQTWLLTQAPGDLRRLAKRGLLPDDKLLRAFEDAIVLAPLLDLQVEDLPPMDDCSEPADAEDGTIEEVAMLERIEALLPGAAVKMVTIDCYRRGSSYPVQRRAISVAITVGDIAIHKLLAAVLGS